MSSTLGGHRLCTFLGGMYGDLDLPERFVVWMTTPTMVNEADHVPAR